MLNVNYEELCTIIYKHYFVLAKTQHNMKEAFFFSSELRQLPRGMPLLRGTIGAQIQFLCLKSPTQGYLKLLLSAFYFF